MISSLASSHPATSLKSQDNKNNSLTAPDVTVAMLVERTIAKKSFSGVEGWRSGESTRLTPLWPGFNSQILRHMWVEFVGSLLCTERFSPGTPVSLLLKKTTFDLLC